jgi:hypothetical protein
MLCCTVARKRVYPDFTPPPPPTRTDTDIGVLYPLTTPLLSLPIAPFLSLPFPLIAPIPTPIPIFSDVHHGNGTEETIRWLTPGLETSELVTPMGFGTLSAPRYKPWHDANDAGEG